MKNFLLAVHHWLQTDIHGNVPARFMSGNMRFEQWQWQLFAAFMVGIVVLVCIGLAFPWL
jgi:hypothetical protein